MAEIQAPTPEKQSTAPDASNPPNGKPPQQKRGSPLNQVYALPAPVKTFPLPTFYPNNPISLLHIAYAWLGQVFRPPPKEPSRVHRGVWSAATGSVHVTDEISVRALWEQGFYGKGSLSRSEPNWLKREEVRRGIREGHVSEINTVQRRQERQQAKWERARLEQEAIRQTRLEEARQIKEAESAHGQPSRESLAPVGPTELLALPNSLSELRLSSTSQLEHAVSTTSHGTRSNGFSEPLKVQDPPAELDVASNGHHREPLRIPSLQKLQNGNTTPIPSPARSSPSEAMPSTVTTPDQSPPRSDMKRRKSVRFSPQVEEATFQLHDPPSPGHTAMNGTVEDSRSLNGSIVPDPIEAPLPIQPIVNKEHLQLMPEEVMFLKFGFGALAVTDSDSGRELSTADLLTLFRQHSYFPPYTGPDDPDLSPDDGFLLHYAVYHHFRSLGWVPRAGIKFGCDWLLYTRGPVFDHAEYGLIVLPSYSDPWWKAAGKHEPYKSWAWLHSIIRVLSHVMKSLVLVYVDIPPPPKFDEALAKGGMTEMLKLYHIREIMVKRWSSNRNR